MHRPASTLTATAEIDGDAVRTGRAGSGRSELRSLTGIRGIAALLVMGYHVAQGASVHLGLDGAIRAFLIRDCFRAVDMFFILSGFILMVRHERDFRIVTTEALRRFFVARLFRIYPVHVVVLTLILVLVLATPGFVAWSRGLDPHAFSPAGFVQTLLLVNRWAIPDLGRWNGPTWSLSLELLGYLMFPLLALRIGRIRSPSAAILVACAVLGLMVAEQLLTGTANANKIGRVAFFRMAGCFVAGIALARVRSLRPDAGGRAWPRILAFASSLALLALLACGPTRVLAPFAIGFIILGISYQRGRIDGFLACRPVHFLGEISYPFYLVHATLLDVAFWLHDAGRLPDGGGGVWAAIGVAFALSLGLATLIHHLVERPGQTLGRRVLRRRIAAAP